MKNTKKIIWKSNHGPMQYDTQNRFMIWHGKTQQWGLYRMNLDPHSECVLLYEDHYMKNIKKFAEKLINK